MRETPHTSPRLSIVLAALFLSGHPLALVPSFAHFPDPRLPAPAVLLNGVDVRELRQVSLRAAVAVVPQVSERGATGARRRLGPRAPPVCRANQYVAYGKH